MKRRRPRAKRSYREIGVEPRPAAKLTALAAMLGRPRQEVASRLLEFAVERFEKALA